MMLPSLSRAVLAGASIACLTGSAPAQLRVAEYNVTNYQSGRVSEFETVFYASFSGRSLEPDIVIAQEFLSSSSLSNFLSILNNAPGSPGDWAVAPYVNSNDTDNAFFYRTSKVSFLGVTTVSTGSGAPNHPRNLERYDVRPVGYSGAAATLACYSSHMKAGSTGTDQARRLVEAQELRDDAESLPAGWNFLIGADFNIQSSTQSAYQEMVGVQANNAGRFFDPISRPGTWNNSSAFRFLHTQDPIGAGGMDDRHDQILISTSLVDGEGFEYIGQFGTSFSATTWNDPNHSYRCWGNDGSSFNSNLTVGGNAMVGATIAQALQDAAVDGGHLPVFLDLRVPPEAGADAVVDFGQWPVGAFALADVDVFNDGDVALWTAAGVSDLEYTLSASAGFNAPAGSFTEGAGGGVNVHTLSMDTTTPGLKFGTLTILSNSPDEPAKQVTLMGEVTGTGGGFTNFCFGDGGDQMGCTDCPCGNNSPIGSQGGCRNSTFSSAQLIASGTASVAADTLRFEMIDAAPNTFAVLSSGAAQAPNNAANPCFTQNPGSGILAMQFDGLRCIVVDFQRHGPRATDANGDSGFTTPGWGPPDGPPGGLIAFAGFSAGQTRHFQAIYRDSEASICMTGSNTTQGVTVTIEP